MPVTATGPYGTASATIAIRVDGPLYGGLPVITSAAVVSSQEIPGSISPYYYPDGPANTAVNYTLTAANGPVSRTAANVPAGMGFNPCTATLSGQPTAVGTFQVPVSATNARNRSAARRRRATYSLSTARRSACPARPSSGVAAASRWRVRPGPSGC